jgi:hypothetical protein
MIAKHYAETMPIVTISETIASTNGNSLAPILDISPKFPRNTL